MLAPTGLTPVITAAPAGVSSANVSLSSVPQFHSNSGARVAIYLDFIGAPAQTWGPYNVPQTPAFDQDGDATTFSSGEIAAIQETWARVAEKYSPFNVDVTTVAPAALVHGQNLEVVIGGTGSWSGGVYGGLSYTGSFASGGSFSPNISWVFSQNLANAPHYIAEACAHEAGHEFGLTHHSTWSGTTLASEYDPGNALTAPIMGNSYSAQRGIWENGLSDNSSTSYQDDMAIISNATNGFGYRAQDHGQTLGTANPLTLSGTSISGSGVIAQTTDTDYFSFTTGAGAVTLNVNVAQYGPTLHARAQLFDASGNLIATAADANNLSQTISTTLAAGTYYIAVESFGQYGDVGQYTVSGSVAPGQPTVIQGPSNSNVFYLSMDPNGANIDVWLDNANPGSGSPDLVVSARQPLQLIGSTGDDTFILDERHGVIALNNGLSIDGRAGSNYLKLIGSSTSNTLTLTTSSIVFDSASTAIANVTSVTYADGNGDDVVAVSGVIPFIWDLGTGQTSLNASSGSSVTVYDSTGSGGISIDGAGSVMIFFGAADPNPILPPSNGSAGGAVTLSSSGSSRSSSSSSPNLADSQPSKRTKIKTLRHPLNGGRFSTTLIKDPVLLNA
jgi:hypothetical protein